jgi:GntR family transcriptional repressor for pyruvate dehydrogenase complex
MSTDLDAVPDRQWTRDELASYLEKHFLSGSLPAGAPLPSERALCEAFGASRPFVREVLIGLQQRGRIEIRPGRGAFVREVGVSDVARAMRESGPVRAATPRTLVEARLTLEKQTAALAAVRATPQQLTVIERALAAFDASEHLIERARADIAFHLLIARASGNPVLETMFGSIATLVFELMLKSLGDPGTSRQGIPYHHDILRALKEHDAAAAVAAVAAHIGLAEQTFGEDYDTRLDMIAKREVQRALGHDAPVDSIISAALEEFTSEDRRGR